MFFALWPDASVRDALINARNRLADKTARAVADTNVDAGLLDALIDAGRRVEAPRFLVGFDRVERRKGMLWLVPSAVPPGLPALYESIWASVEANPGIARESRAFRPHITLARKHRGAPRADQVAPVSWQADAFSLVESVQAERVSIYRPLRTFRLG